MCIASHLANLSAFTDCSGWTRCATQIKTHQKVPTLIWALLQVWLPVRLIQSRIEGEVKNNLAAVKRHSEGLCNGKKRSPGAQP